MNQVNTSLSIVESLNLRRHFCYHFQIPIYITDSPYFDYFVDLYDSMYNVREKLEWMAAYVNRCGSEKAFFEQVGRLRGRVIDAIKRESAFSELTNDSLSSFVSPFPFAVKSVFSSEDDGKWYISMKIQKANFTALQFYSNSLVLEAPSYEALIQKFDNHPYAMRSRGLRMLLFSHLLPKKQMILQKFLMGRIYEMIADIATKDRLKFFGSEEIIIRSDDYSKDLDELRKRLSGWPFLRIRPFYMRELKGHTEKDSHFFVKEWEENQYFRFKAVPSYWMAQCLKKYKGLPVHEYDRAFLFEGKRAFFDTVLFPPNA